MCMFITINALYVRSVLPINMCTHFTGLASLYTYPTKNVEQQHAVSRLIHNKRLHGLFVFCAVFCMEYGKVSGCCCRMRNFHHQWFHHTAKSAGCFYFSMVLKLIPSRRWFWISFINVFLSIDTERRWTVKQSLKFYLLFT